MAYYISRVIPSATLHLLPNEGHFSFFFFCDDCHRQILSSLFGDPLGPLDIAVDIDYIDQENTTNEEASPVDATAD